MIDDFDDRALQAALFNRKREPIKLMTATPDVLNENLETGQAWRVIDLEAAQRAMQDFNEKQTDPEKVTLDVLAFLPPFKCLRRHPGHKAP